MKQKIQCFTSSTKIRNAEWTNIRKLENVFVFSQFHHKKDGSFCLTLPREIAYPSLVTIVGFVLQIYDMHDACYLR